MHLFTQNHPLMRSSCGAKCRNGRSGTTPLHTPPQKNGLFWVFFFFRVFDPHEVVGTRLTVSSSSCAWGGRKRKIFFCEVRIRVETALVASMKRKRTEVPNKGKLNRALQKIRKILFTSCCLGRTGLQYLSRPYQRAFFIELCTWFVCGIARIVQYVGWVHSVEFPAFEWNEEVLGSLCYARPSGFEDSASDTQRNLPP